MITLQRRSHMTLICAECKTKLSILEGATSKKYRCPRCQLVYDSDNQVIEKGSEFESTIPVRASSDPSVPEIDQADNFFAQLKLDDSEGLIRQERQEKDHGPSIIADAK